MSYGPAHGSELRVAEERLLEVAGRDALEDRDQHFEALRSARGGRQNRRREADALGAFADAVVPTS
jgi:hypothetical protein